MSTHDNNAIQRSSATTWPAQGGAPAAGEIAWVVGVGAIEGTGAAVARRFAQAGMHVVVTGRTGAKLDVVVTDIANRGGTATAVVADVSSQAGLDPALVELDRLGLPAITVYNAGGAQRRKTILDMDEQFFEDVWRINCLGGVLIGREAAARMSARGGGVILFTGSKSGVVSAPKLTAYCIAKFGQRAAVQALAREFGPANVHVANIIPDGPIDGERIAAAFPGVKSQRPVDSMIDIEALAESFWQVAIQPRTAWTHEMDIRPFTEPL
jgi:NAD(P)-dependent dehydrogenase (short-subunit alcohol dehydrogenase family)